MRFLLPWKPFGIPLEYNPRSIQARIESFEREKRSLPSRDKTPRETFSSKRIFIELDLTGGLDRCRARRA